MTKASSNPENRERIPFVSVIINCYNSAKYLREALDCVLAQTFTDWEIIFWDNQSTDESAEIFKSYSDPRMKYFQAPEFTVLGKARNLAVEKAKGFWLGFLDCDDIWLPEKLEKQVEIINKGGKELGLVYGQMLVIIDEESKSVWSKRMLKYQTKTRLAKLPEGYIFEELLCDNFVPLLTAMVSSVAFSNVGGINSTFKQAEDFDLFVKISEHYEASAVQEVIALYRVHGANISEIQHTKTVAETIEIVNRYLPSRIARKALKFHFANEAIYRIRSKDFIGFINLIKKSDGIVGLFIALFKVVFYHLRIKFVRTN